MRIYTPVEQRIIRYLAENGPAQSVQEIQRALCHARHYTVALRIRQLQQAGIVQTQREGRRVRVWLVDDLSDPVMEIL